MVFRWMLKGLGATGLVSSWALTVVEQLMLGGDAWTEAERAKIADLNWRIIMRKPK